ncbi:MAG: TraR/DksA family transcriptional regulator [Deltaproteobacteria bacterium]|nr:TraR/DksA family transcriptional regulator [Deltaproteobacteria bacterium]
MAARTREKDLTAAQVKELTHALSTKRDELLDALKSRRSDSAKQETQRGTGDEADQASEDAETALETRLMDRDAKLLREVERALDKVKNNTYGLCEGTEEPIGYARLKLRPWTRYSVTYKEELEREQKRQGEG